MKKQWIILGFMLLVGLAHAEITMQLESTTTTLGQPFRIVLSIDDSQAVGVPDLTPLRQDFSIVGTERSMNYSLINGQARSLSQWVIILMPKRSGTLTIPPIKVGQEQTQATNIEVNTDASATTHLMPQDQQQSVMLIAEVSNNQPYVNQQVIYTVKLLNDRPLLDAEYQAPKVENALLIPLGDGQRSQTVINGTPYSIEELKYAIFPQKSGELKITPPLFRALLAEAVPQSVAVEAKSITLKVKPVPANETSKAWLPANQVTISEDYDQAVPFFKQGDTLVRTITVQATGMAAQLMPPLNLGASDQFNTYPEKPIEKTLYNQQQLMGTTTIKVTYLFNKAGKVVIPALKLPWFNTITGKASVAALPEKLIEVKASVNSQPVEKANSKEIAPTSATQPTTITNASALPWWIATIFALAWLITAGLWWWYQSPHNKNRLANAHKKLRSACVSNQAQQAKEALIEWANCVWPEAQVLNLADIVRLVRDPILKKQLNQLSEVLYHAKPHATWRGEDLWRAVNSYKPSKAVIKIKPGSLPPINPDQAA